MERHFFCSSQVEAESRRVMGRDVAGLRVSSLKSKFDVVSQGRVKGENSKGSIENSKEKDTLVKEVTTDVAPSGLSDANHDKLGFESLNIVETKNEEKSSKIEETEPISAMEAGLDLVGGSSTAPETSIWARNSPPDSNSLHSPGSLEKPQSSHEEKIKNNNTNALIVSKKHLEDGDDWSMASSTTTSVRRRSRTTVPMAPTFRCNERLAKRREFYAKLEEKHQALEVEKCAREARNKEVEQDVIKQMRKSMVVKANPVPSFYYEGPPPKKELKKPATTRAVSPKLGRRKSFGDAVSSAAERARVPLHNLGNHSHGRAPFAPTSTTSKKNDLDHDGSKKERPKLRVI